MEIQFYPIDVEYEVREEGPAIYMYGKAVDGKRICVIDFFQPYFYVEQDPHKNVLELLENIEVQSGKVTYKIAGVEDAERTYLDQRKSLLKVFAPVPKAVPMLKDKAVSLGLTCYEYDILFTYRYLIDKQITPMTLVSAEGEYIESKTKIPVFLADSVEQVDGETLSDIKILAFDIETYAKDKVINPAQNPILMVAFYGNYRGKELKKVITWKRFSTDLPEVEFVEDEKELLERFAEVIRNYQPDIITGYYSDVFDFPYLSTRAMKYGIELRMGLDNSSLSIRGMKESKITGIVHLDVFKFVRQILWRGLKTDVYTLDAVAHELLGFGKYSVDLNKLADAWDEGSDELSVFCHYNLQDAFATFKLCEKLFFDMVEFVKLIGLPLYDITRMRFSKLVENYLLRRAVEFTILAPNKPEYHTVRERLDQRYSGGFVFQPEPGVYNDLVVFDFRSLYPTIITSHNIGPSTLNCACCTDNKEIPGTGHKFCKITKGFLPTVVEGLIVRRMRVKDLIKKVTAEKGNVQLLQARSEALKIMTNSFYGYMGFFAARWYSIECAESVTAQARYYIKKVISEAGNKGFSVIYSDTDSIFLSLDGKSKAEALAFVEEFNETLTGYMELEYEGCYPRGIFVPIKGQEKGAKKKYALLSEDGVVKVTGFESVRRNWSPISKEVQEKVLDLVLKENKKNEALAFVKYVISDLRKQKVDVSKMVINTQLQKPVESYESVGPHVAIARKMIAKGQAVGPGTLIKYVVTKGTGFVRDRVKLPEDVPKNGYDAEYYINNQIVPAVSSIFSVFGYSEQELLKDEGQSELGRFL